MQDTVDQAHNAVPRTLADIIQDAFRPCVVTAARQLQQGVLILGTGPDGLPLARFARARLQGLIGEADMTAVLVLAGEVFTDATVIYGTTRWAPASG
jgi:hypothetical protein